MYKSLFDPHFVWLLLWDMLCGVELATSCRALASSCSLWMCLCVSLVWGSHPSHVVSSPRYGWDEILGGSAYEVWPVAFRWFGFVGLCCSLRLFWVCFFSVLPAFAAVPVNVIFLSLSESLCSPYSHSSRRLSLKTTLTWMNCQSDFRSLGVFIYLFFFFKLCILKLHQWF